MLVPRVEFISAPGTSPAGVYRPGGPYALVPAAGVPLRPRTARPPLQSVHPGHTVAEVVEQTGFAFDLPGDVAETPPPSPIPSPWIRGPVGRAIAETYPGFALRVLGVAA